MISLIQGECLEVMKQIPDGSVDMVLTDPPYNISMKNQFHTMGRSGIDFGEWDKGFDLISWMDELPRILKRDCNVLIFNDWKNLGLLSEKLENIGFSIKDLFRWEKTNPMPRNRDRRFIIDYEFAIWACRGKWTFNRENEHYKRPRYVTSSPSKKTHPNQKPTDLMEFLVRTLSNDRDLILDPFMGSGSTGVACKNLNRNFIGIELDEKYFNIAKQRIEGVQ